MVGGLSCAMDSQAPYVSNIYFIVSTNTESGGL